MNCHGHEIERITQMISLCEELKANDLANEIKHDPKSELMIRTNNNLKRLKLRLVQLKEDIK